MEDDEEKQEEEEEEEEKKEKKKEKKEKEEEGQEPPYTSLTPDRPPLVAFTGNNNGVSILIAAVINSFS